MELQTICHLIVKDKVAEQHILGKYSNCNSLGVTKALLNSNNFKVAIQCATGLKLYSVITYQNWMNNTSKKFCLTSILLKIFDIYFCHYFATNQKIAVTYGMQLNAKLCTIL